MSLFGKILLVFNLLAAGGFVYLATKDWKGRQTITAAGLRHQLLVVGIPLDDPADPAKKSSDPDVIPFAVEGPGGVPTETISKKLLDVYFQAAPGGDALGGPAVPNQIAEVRRVKAKIEGLLKEAPDRTALLSGWLLLQAESFDERAEIQGLAAKNNAEELEKRLLAKFDAVINAPKASDPAATARLTEDDKEDAEKVKDKLARVAEARSAPLDEGERRTRLAHLLVHLSPDPAWQKRVMVVVGLRKYVGVIGAQAKRFQDMSQRITELILADQKAYFGQEAVDLALSQQRTDLANRQAEIRKKWTDQATQAADFVGQRKTQLGEIEKQLKKIKSEVDEMLVKQSNIETGLFEVQREVAITLDEVYKLYDDLAARERQLLEAAGRPGGK